MSLRLLNRFLLGMVGMVYGVCGAILLGMALGWLPGAEGVGWVARWLCGVSGVVGLLVMAGAFLA